MTNYLILPENIRLRAVITRNKVSYEYFTPDEFDRNNLQRFIIANNETINKFIQDQEKIFVENILPDVLKEETHFLNLLNSAILGAKKYKLKTVKVNEMTIPTAAAIELSKQITERHKLTKK